MTDIIALESVDAKRRANAKLTRNLTAMAESLVAATGWRGRAFR